MDRDTQLALIDRYLALEAAGRTQLDEAPTRLAADRYTGRAQFDREVARLFRQAPVLACLASDVAAPGSYVAIESGGVPIIVVRDGAELRAFLNICRHRAAPLVSGAGSTRAFVCPFHAWTYRTDGQLAAQPRSMGGFDDLPTADRCLRSVPVAEAAGLVFVRPEGDEPIDVDAHLAGLGIELAAYRLDGFVAYARRRSTWQANWKLIVDTYMESYHVFSLHKGSVGPDYPGHVMVYDPFGPHLRFPVPRATLFALRDQPRESWNLLQHATVQYLLGPVAIVNHTVDHVLTWRFLPEAPDRTTIEMVFYVPAVDQADDRRPYWDDWVNLHLDVTYQEDFPASEAIHRTLVSGRVEATTLGANEIAVRHFHRAVDAACR